MNVPHRIVAPEGESLGAVLLYHGLRSSLASLDGEAARLARSGITAILIDAPHHGGRFSEVLGSMPDALSLPGHYVLLRLIREARDEVPGLVDWALDLGHRRVAIGGVSFGAFIALAAATVEPRLAATVSLLGSPDWTPRDGLVPADLEAAVAESPHRHAFLPPRPLLLLNGGDDENVRPGPARELAARLAPIYEEAGIALTHREFPGTSHWPTAAVWDEMWRTAESFLRDAFRSVAR